MQFLLLQKENKTQNFSYYKICAGQIQFLASHKRLTNILKGGNIKKKRVLTKQGIYVRYTVFGRMQSQ